MPIDGDIILKAGLDTSGITKRIDGLQKVVSRGLKNVIRIGFGVRSVFALIRKMRTALFEGFENLAQVHEPFNTAMSEIMTSLNLLKNTFAAAFAPIIETVAPIITRFVNMMADAVSAVGQFIAALTGKEYVHAGAVWQDYASSVDKSTSNTRKQTSATKKQTEAQKKLNREITHFDDLVILHDKDNDADTSDTTPVTPNYSFTPMAIGDAVGNFADQFKAALATVDFTDIGRKISDKLSTELEKIKWESIYEKARGFGKGLATFLNGLITPRLFENIGKSVGGALNTALSFLDSFGENFNWKNFGDSLGKGLAKFFETWDADLTANTFGVFVNGLADTIKSALDSFPAESVGSKISNAIRKSLKKIDWQNKVFPAARTFGTKLAKFLNGLFNEDTFATIGKTVANLLNTALHVLDSFGTTFNWKNFGKSLGKGLRTFFKTWKAGLTAKVFSTFVNGLADALKAALDELPTKAIGSKVATCIKKALKGIKWKESVFPAVKTFGSKLANFLNGLFDEETFKTVASTVASTLNAALALLNSFGDTFEWSSFGSSLASALKTFFTTFDWELAADTFTTLVNGLIDTLNSLADNITDEDLKTLANNITTSIKNAVTGISWAEIYKVASNFGSGLATFLSELFDENTFSTLGSAIGTALTSGLKFLDTFGTTFKNNGGFKKFGLSISAAINSFFNTFSFKNLASALNTWASGLLKAIKTAIGGDESGEGGVDWESIGTEVGKFIRDIQWEDHFTGIAEILGSAIQAVIDTAKGLLDPSGLGTPLTSALDTIKKTCEDFADAVDWEGLGASIKSVVDALAPAVEGFAQGFADTFSVLGALGVEILNAIGAMLQAVADALNAMDPEVLNKIGSALGSIVAPLLVMQGLTTLGGTIKGIAKALTSFGTGGALAAGGATAAAGGAGKLASKFGFLVTPLAKALGGISAFTWALDETKTPLDDGTADTDELKQSVDDLYTSFTTLNPEIPVTKDNFGEVVTALQNTTTESKNISTELDTNLTPSIKDVGTETKNTSSETSGLKDTISKFISGTISKIKSYSETSSLSYGTIQTALDNLGNSYTVDEGLVEALGVELNLQQGSGQTAVSAYKDVKEALEKLTGETGEAGKALDKELGKALLDSGSDATSADKDIGTMKSNIWKFAGGLGAQAILMAVLGTTFKGFGDKADTAAGKITDMKDDIHKDLKDVESDAKTAGTGFKTGLIDTLENARTTLASTVKDMADKDMLGTLKTELDINSPSKEAENISKDFMTGLDNGITNNKETLKTTAEGVATTITNAFSDLDTDLENAGSDAMSALKDEFSDTVALQNIKSSATGVADTIKSGFSTLADDLKAVGKNAISSLSSGFSDTTTIQSLETSASDVMSKIKTKMESYNFSSVGNNIGTAIYDGLVAKKTTLETGAYNSMIYIYNKGIKYIYDNNGDGGFSFYNLGKYIGKGIYDGLSAYNGTLETLAWNTAINMYNSACAALGIASPSKEFAWIGEMTMKGLQEGIVDNQNLAVDATTDMVDAITDETAKASPTIELDTSVKDWLDSLDTVLTTFADNVSDKFTELITTLSQMNVSTYTLPNVVQGKVIPSAVNNTNMTADNTSTLVSALQDLVSSRLSTDDLRSLLVEMFTRYLNIDFYIEDERLARHTNQGNLKLQYRYNTL